LNNEGQERRQPAQEWRWKPQQWWIPSIAPDVKVITNEERSMLQELALPLLFFFFFFIVEGISANSTLLLGKWDSKIQMKYT